MIEKTNAEENEKWLCAERIALNQWQKMQEKRKILLQEHLEREAKIIVVSLLHPLFTYYIHIF